MDIEETGLWVGHNKAPYYHKKFSEIERTGKKLSFNAGALFFGFLWLLYRKLYGEAFLYLFLTVVFSVSGTLAVVYESAKAGSSSNQLRISFVFFILFWVTHFYFALSANNLLYNKIAKLRAAFAKRIDRREYGLYAKEHGGDIGAFGIIGVLVLMAIANVFLEIGIKHLSLSIFG